MNTTDSYNKTSPDTQDSTTLAATFADRERAHDAVHRLHDEGFSDTWIGITRSHDGSGYGTEQVGETRVESENWFTRFFGEGDETLHDALVRHGVAESDARYAGALAPNSAILTVDGSNHPELAAQIITEQGGVLVTRGFGGSGYETAGSFGVPSSSATAESFAAGRSTSISGAAPYDVADDVPAATANYDTAPRAAGEPLPGAATSDLGKYRGGAAIDADTRIQLREERLRVGTERLARGEATIGKDVVSETQEIDVPVIREELFIERRPVASGMPADTTGAAIGSDREVIRIPLTEEKVNVSKVTVVTEEIVVGTRQVEDTVHVSETTRKEQLNVHDVDAAIGAGTTRDPRI